MSLEETTEKFNKCGFMMEYTDQNTQVKSDITIPSKAFGNAIALLNDETIKPAFFKNYDFVVYHPTDEEREKGLT